ncbi:MAG: peroxiredoxin family protein [Dehalococcoidia bacterium]
MLQVGDRMPSFSLRNSNREEVTQDDFLGSVAVLAFYPMSFTGGCTREMQGFQQSYEDFQALGVKIAGISSDTWATQGVFCEQHNLEFPVLSDWPKYATIAAFGVDRPDSPLARRVTFVFDADGICRLVIDEEREMDAHRDGALAIAKTLAAGAAS